jgi:hypothetical protein
MDTADNSREIRAGIRTNFMRVMEPPRRALRLHGGGGVVAAF